MYAIHEASLQSHELYCDDPIRSSSTSIEIRNYLVANPMYINNELYETFLETSPFSSNSMLEETKESLNSTRRNVNRREESYHLLVAILLVDLNSSSLSKE